VSAARARMDAARANVREAVSKYERAAKDLERLRPLVAKDEISQREFDAAVANADAARASVDSAKATAAEAERNVATAEVRVRQIQQSVSQSQASLANARTAPEQIAVTQAQSSSAEAKVQQMKAALDQAKLNLQYTVVKAPISGWVSRKSVEAGQVIQPTQPLLAVVPLEDVWVTANFKETQLKNMRPGEHADISVDAYGGKHYDGHVESISAATGARFSLLPPENATGNYVKVVQRIPVKIVFEKGQDPEHLLRPGMSVAVTVLTK
jgi:membrane fusion protein, multidrug efflux system